MAGFHVAGQSWLHQLDPMTKLLVAGVVIAMLFVWPTLPANTAVVVTVLVLLATAGLIIPALTAYAAVLLAALTFLVIQAVAHPAGITPLFEVGPLTFYREGAAVGALLALRLFGILSGMLLLLLATRPTDLVEALMRRGLPARAGWVLASVVQILPTITGRLAIVRDAQRSRGMESRGSPAQRLRATTALLTPVVTSSLVAAEERALALEVRGFSSGGTRTYFRDEQRPQWATAVRLATVGLFVLAIAGRIVA